MSAHQRKFSLDMLHASRISKWGGPYRQDVTVEGIQVDKDVDACIGKGGHAV